MIPLKLNGDSLEFRRVAGSVELDPLSLSKVEIASCPTGSLIPAICLTYPIFTKGIKTGLGQAGTTRENWGYYNRVRILGPNPGNPNHSRKGNRTIRKASCHCLRAFAFPNSSDHLPRKRSVIVNSAPLCQIKCAQLTMRQTLSKAKLFGQQTSEHSKKQRCVKSRSVYATRSAWRRFSTCFKGLKKILLRRIYCRLRTLQYRILTSGTTKCRAQCVTSRLLNLQKSTLGSSALQMLTLGGKGQTLKTWQIKHATICVISRNCPSIWRKSKGSFRHRKNQLAKKKRPSRVRGAILSPHIQLVPQTANENLEQLSSYLSLNTSQTTTNFQVRQVKLPRFSTAILLGGL